MNFLDLHLQSLKQDREETFEDYFTRFGSLTETVFQDDEATRKMAQVAFVQGRETGTRGGSLSRQRDLLQSTKRLTGSSHWRGKRQISRLPGVWTFSLTGPKEEHSQRDLAPTAQVGVTPTTDLSLPLKWTSLPSNWTGFIRLCSSSNRRRLGQLGKTLTCPATTTQGEG